MRVLEKKAEDITPSVYFSKEESKFFIAGRSIIEYPDGFYEEVMTWIQEYVQDPNDLTLIEVELEYFNTPSAPYIKKMVEEFKKVEEKGKELKVKWLYEVDDEDMLEIGKNFENILEVEFEFVETTD